ncbi:MAG: BrnA antitoxin family protein [Ruminococcus sp.]|nr:BrnA antitoxin family protein [Ruminococcus sp.]
MRNDYDIKNLNPRKNPYSGKLKKQITINIDTSTIDYFKALAEETGVPYQTLINLYLTDCAKQNKKLTFTWK